MERWLVAGGLCLVASLCGSCARAPAIVPLAQSQGHYTDCVGLAIEGRTGCRRPPHEPTISVVAERTISVAAEPTISVAAAANPPNLNISPTCQSSEAKFCLADETSARDTLVKNWQRYSAADKMQCVGMVNRGGPPSYVELISCLDTMHEASVAKEATSTATTGRARPGATREPIR